jgi:hypothetical protein
MYNKIIAVFILSAVLFGFKQNISTSSNQTDDFSIYLLKSDTLKTREAKQQPLNSLTLARRPFISIDDIVSYDWSQHNITLTPKGIKKVRSFFAKRTSAEPIPFVVVVGKEKIYLGTIFIIGAPYVVPDLPYIHSSFKTTLMIFRSPDSPGDQRSDERVRKALQKRDKLERVKSK